MKSPLDTGRPAAFTLIELLATLGVITALAVLLVAGTKKVRQMGDLAATTNTMRNIGTAIHQYAADNDARLPGPLTVAVYNWTDPQSENTVCTLTRYIHPYLGTTGTRPWFSYPTREHVPAIDNPSLSPVARKTELVAQFAKLDYPSTSEDNIFGSQALSTVNFASRQTVLPQPKTLAGLTEKARRSAILTTADQVSWSANPLLPTNGVFNGKRLYLFLDGSVQGPVATNGIWTR